RFHTGRPFLPNEKHNVAQSFDLPRGEGVDDRLRRRSSPLPLSEIPLRDAKVGDLKSLSEKLGLSLSIEEMTRIQEYFRRIGREPTDVELQSLGQAWSEHGCYKSSKVFLKEFICPVQAP